jgi:hypothetical protein
MKHISELQTTLSNFFDWHKSRLDCLGQIIQALFVVRTINLTQIASAFKSEVKEESSYRRICRFFTGFTFDMSTIVPNSGSHELEVGTNSHQYLDALDRL